jgi:hypothetical protein
MGAVLSAAGLSAEVDGAIATVHTDDGLLRRLIIEKPRGRSGRLAWSIQIADADLQPLLRPPFEGFGVIVELTEHRTGGYVHMDYAWPTSARPPDPRLVQDLATHAGDGLAVVRDRHDLALVLLADETVHRGAFSMSLNRGNSAARLAQALIIARHAADADAEEAVLTKLDQHGDELDSGNPYREVVGYWAAVYRPLVPVDLSDVAAKKAVLPVHPF